MASDNELRQLAGHVWAVRARIEREAHRRFERLAHQVKHTDPESPVGPLLEQAAGEELIHAALCEELAVGLGAPLLALEPERSVAPRLLEVRQALLYEVVAACCVSETESVATLTVLLSKMGPSRYRDVVHQIARDEVLHSKAGWAHLAREGQLTSVDFLSSCVESMVDFEPVHRLFEAAPSAAHESEDLYAYGVMPHSQKRSIFIEMLTQVIARGFSAHGVDCGALSSFLTRMQARLA